MADYMASLRDSIETSVSMGLFASPDAATRAHLGVSEPVKFPLSRFAKGSVDNFNPARLKASAAAAYPPADRPRGARDLASVRHHAAAIAAGREPAPVWILARAGGFVLLDGAHRVVASHIAARRYVAAYVLAA